jgi:hypothetical protein
MGDEAYDDALLEQGFQEGQQSVIKGIFADLQAANTRRVLREGIVSAQMAQIAQAILELSQFSDDLGLTISSRDNMQSIVKIYSKREEAEASG